jgi:DNA helicase-2/ATP-dependent DNA helicase PcrA
VDLANRLLAARRSGGPAADRLWAEPLQLTAQQPAGAEPEFTECSDDEAEATAVARRIGQLVAAGTQPKDIAVLFRTNGQSEAFEQALASAGIGYQLRGGERFFNRREVRDAVAQLRTAARSQPAGVPLGQAVRDVLSSLGYADEPPSGSGATRERWESLSALVSLADELSAARGEEFGMPEFVLELHERASAQHAPSVQGVTLASLHAAKGLEWEAVFLVGLSEGLVPISFADTPVTVDEERRLFYVGITRARQFLHLSWSLARTPGGRAHRRPSRFLDGLRPGSVRTTAGIEGGSGSRRRREYRGPAVCRVCGSVLETGAERKVGRCADCPPSYDEATFESLRGWRLEQARAADVPAFVIFTDATLTAIAEAKPASLAELANVAGVGKAKLERYGEAVLELLRGE